MLIYTKITNQRQDTWQGFPGIETDDVQFTTDILAEVSRLYNIDSTRISATGKSDGGSFVNVLACDSTLSTRVAAFAPVSGAYYVDTDCCSVHVNTCTPSTVRIPCLPEEPTFHYSRSTGRGQRDSFYRRIPQARVPPFDPALHP